MSGNIGQIGRLVPELQNSIKPDAVVKGDQDGVSFTEVFTNLIDSVNTLQMEAGKAQELMAAGEAADLHQVMIAAEEAGIAMDLLLEIRNRLLEAYQTLMRMPM
jgi:flagellar hook-basal body complex protein FliE